MILGIALDRALKQAYQLSLGVTVALNIALRSAKISVSDELLDIAETAARPA